MTRLSVFVGCSLDGFIADAAGGLAWLEGLAGPDEDYGFDAFLDAVDALAMGRGTYDHIASLDPLPFGPRPVHVFTHHAPRPRPGVTSWDVSPVEALARWEAAGLQRVYVDGGVLISSFLAAGLIDDLTLTVAPVLLGSGRPLFHPGYPHAGLVLAGTRSWPSGFVQLAYARA